MHALFFQNWEQITRTLIGTATTYVVLIVLLRIAGPRVLAKWYAFDLIVTVALGSTFASGVLSKDITVAQAVAGFILLIGMQFSIAWAVVRWSGLRKVVNPSPTLVLLHGRLQASAMKRERVAEADIRAAIRQSGADAMEDIGAVVLEADGTFSVIRTIGRKPSALADIPELGGSERSNASL